jgi:hypothetical protein
MGLPEILALFLLISAGWFVWDSLKARETANAAMRAACEARGLLFLDDTVSLQWVRPMRDDNGRVTLRRSYRFQYSDTGHNRRDAMLTLLGGEVLSLDLPTLQESGT